MGIIALIILALVIIGLVVWFIIKNKKPTPPTPVPVDPTGDTPDSGDTPDTGGTEPVDTGDTEPVDTGGTEPVDTGDTEPACIAESETHKTGELVDYLASQKRVKIGWYETENICDGVWSVVGYANGDNFLSDIEFKDGEITAVVSGSNYGEIRDVRILTHLTAEYGSKDDYFDVTQAGAIDSKFSEILAAFKSEADVKPGTKLYDYLQSLYAEARTQYYNGSSTNGIPALLKEENFPNIYDYYGTQGDSTSAFNTLVGWVFALTLAELKPKRRTYIIKIGYEVGGYDKYSNIYGYKFEYDPNIMRLVGSAIYSTMRGVVKPDTDTMRQEIGGSKYNVTLDAISSGSRDDVGDNDFFIDFRQMMPTAPGPYAPGYTTRPDNTYPNEKKDGYKNLDMDNKIHEFVVGTYNMDNKDNSGRTTQAIADEEWCEYHLFGDNKTVEGFSFHPVFGIDTIGKKLPTDGDMVDLFNQLKNAASCSRGILQSATVNPKQYGRLRPGCSWSQEAKKNSSTDDKRNVLCDIDIEDNDGCKDSANSVGYYNKDGVWVHTQVEENKFCETQKNNLYANSYPSGHSSGIWGGAMGLMELMPSIANKIMAAANSFAINRTIARYHWTSDTINGRVLGSATNAVSHAASDYDELLNKARKEL